MPQFTPASWSGELVRQKRFRGEIVKLLRDAPDAMPSSAIAISSRFSRRAYNHRRFPPQVSLGQPGIPCRARKPVVKNRSVNRISIAKFAAAKAQLEALKSRPQ